MRETVPAYHLVAVPDIIWPDGVVIRGASRQHALEESLLRRRRVLVWDTARAFSEAAESRGSRFTKAEHAYWDTLMAELAELDRRIKAF